MAFRMASRYPVVLHYRHASFERERRGQIVDIVQPTVARFERGYPPPQQPPAKIAFLPDATEAVETVRARPSLHLQEIQPVAPRLKLTPLTVQNLRQTNSSQSLTPDILQRDTRGAPVNLIPRDGIASLSGVTYQAVGLCEFQFQVNREPGLPARATS